MKTGSLKKLYFKDTSFASLMRHRVYNVLLYASKYDAFALEEDGRVDEQIFNEYTSLNLRYPPRFTLVSSEEEANKALEEHTFELIISMPSGDSIDPFEWAKQVKKEYNDIPIVLLTPFSRQISIRMAKEDLSAIDYVFSWLGNSDIFLAIIKLIEDEMNVAEDVESVGVQVIMFVEDSVRYYSSLLPHLYKYVFQQSRTFMSEALNEHEQMLRMRGRPKILMARNYEEAIEIFDNYRKNMLGVITDVTYDKEGKRCKTAGIELCKTIREFDKNIPLIVQSTEDVNRTLVSSFDADFVYKLSNNPMLELRDLITNKFGFGDFVFRNPKTQDEILRVRSLHDLQDKIFDVDNETLYYHTSKDEISRWLYSRAMFPLAEFLENIKIDVKTKDMMDEVKQLIFNSIVSYRRIKNRGVVAVFDKNRFDKYSNFARIGNGSLGGKGRGLAFVDSMLKSNIESNNYKNTEITIPRTVVIATDIFTQFMEENNLYPTALSDIDDKQILSSFIQAKLPKSLKDDLEKFVDTIHQPLAIRSSSLLEDSHYQPFAGIYSTYMVPYDGKDKSNMLKMLNDAIKAVYASVFYKDSKSYLKATKNVIDEEKMAVVIQETVGKYYNNRFYPSFSGVARSLNFYPIGAERAEEGIANIAMGLGKYIVDGGTSLRFSPSHPKNVLQISTLDLALRDTQSYFNALDCSNPNFTPQVDDGFNLLKIDVQDADIDGSLRYIASTYSRDDQRINDNLFEKGRRVITFANILQHDVMPLAEILKNVLNIAHREMGRPIEIEFAVNLSYNSEENHSFNLLQIRPIVDSKEMIHEDVGAIPKEDVIISCNSALGHGVINDIYDIIYVKPKSFDASNNQLIMYEIEKLNQLMLEQSRYYALIGPGRWGSSDVWLGIPVKWPNISQARVIVESGLSNYRIDPSQGTHFFQNLTSFGVSYFTINPFIDDGFYDLNFLDAQDAIYESEYVRHVRFSNPVVVKVDGRKSIGVIQKPEED